MMQKKLYIPIFIGGLILVITIGVGISLSFINKSDNIKNTSSVSTNSSLSNISSSEANSSSTISRLISVTSSSISSSSLNSITSSSSSFKDGTYSANGTFATPGGDQMIGVTLKIQNSKIASVSIQDKTTDERSAEYAKIFSDSISQVVVGQPISKAYLNGQVNGASLTSGGFNNALDTIIIQSQN